MNILYGIIGLVVVALGVYYILPTDNTDKSRWQRSNMRLHTDHLTGLQYLSTGRNLIPRLDENGKQIKVK